MSDATNYFTYHNAHNELWRRHKEQAALIEKLLQRLDEAEEAARSLFDDLSQFANTEWAAERWPWLSAGGENGVA